MFNSARTFPGISRWSVRDFLVDALKRDTRFFQLSLELEEIPRYSSNIPDGKSGDEVR